MDEISKTSLVEMLAVIEKEFSQKNYLGRRSFFILNKIGQFVLEEINKILSRPLVDIKYIQTDKLLQKISLSNWEVLIKLRIFQDEFAVILPLELVSELGADILKKDHENIIDQPSEEILTSFSYLVVKVLSSVRNQKIYLCSVVVSASQELEIKSQTILHFCAQTRIGEFKFRVISSDALIKRLHLFAKYDATLLKEEKIWQKIIIPSQIKLNIKALEIQKLLSLKAQQILAIESKSIAATLSTKTRENKERKIKLDYHGFIWPNKFHFSL